MPRRRGCSACSFGGRLLTKSRRLKAVELEAARGTYSFKWRVAAKYFGARHYVISLRVRDSHRAWSGATHRGLTSD